MELFKEYGLFGYGGYNGISSIEMQDDFRKILLNNLAVKPKSSKSSYTDIYKIKKLNVLKIAMRDWLMVKIYADR